MSQEQIPRRRHQTSSYFDTAGLLAGAGNLTSNIARIKRLATG